jgi:tetratricopeptide (TPR) repeat protein
MKIDIEKIQKNYIEGNYLDVIFQTEDLLDENPDDPNLWNLKGISEAALNDDESAIASFKAGAKKNKSKEGIRKNLAKIYFKIGDINSALNVFEELIKIDPKNFNYFFVCADCCIQLQNYTKGIFYLDCCKKINSTENDDINIGYSICLNGLDRFRESIEICEMLIKKDPLNYKAVNILATNYIGIKEFDMAINLYENNLPNNHSQFEAYNNLGIIYERQNKTSIAENNYRKSLLINDKHVETNYNLANLLIETKREEEALIYLSKGGYRGKIKIPETLYNLGSIEKFEEYISAIKLKIPFDRRIAAIANFYSEQYDVDNPYDWCSKPFNFLSKENIDDLLSEKKLNYEALIQETNTLIEVFEPTDMTTINGYQTTGNLFNIKSINVEILKDIILSKVNDYRDNYKNESSPFIINWPENYLLNGWRVKLLNQGKQEFHIHARAWCSGVFYLNIPKKLNKDEGAIEFGLYGFDYKFKKNKTYTELYMPSKGDLVLFPSSLFHRTIPFDSKEERLCIAFDIVPK